MASSSRSSARRAGRWWLQPSLSRRMRHAWLWLYDRPVTFSITSATRARFQSSVGNPLARGPFSSAASTAANCTSESLERRPARPAARRASFPPCSHTSCQSETVWWETPTRRAISAWLVPPCSNSSAACIRRSSMAAKSRRGPGSLRFLASGGAPGGPGEVLMGHSPTTRCFSGVFRESL